MLYAVDSARYCKKTTAHALAAERPVQLLLSLSETAPSWTHRATLLSSSSKARATHCRRQTPRQHRQYYNPVNGDLSPSFLSIVDNTRRVLLVLQRFRLHRRPAKLVVTETPLIARPCPSATTRTTLAVDMASKFMPKKDVKLDPPKDDVISLDELAKANGTSLRSGRRPSTESSLFSESDIAT